MKKNPAQEIIDVIQILIDNAMKKTTNINGGVITSIDTTNANKYFVKIRGKINCLPSYPKNANINIGDSVFVIVPQGENSQGFILPNSFNNLNNLFITNQNIDISDTPNGDIYNNNIYINDKNNQEIGYIRTVSLNTGEDGIEIGTIKTINGETYNNNIGLFIDKEGNQSVKISNPNAWKMALGIE